MKELLTDASRLRSVPLSMIGSVVPDKGHGLCPICGKRFKRYVIFDSTLRKRVERLTCKRCQTFPGAFYVRIYSKDDKKYFNIRHRKDGLRIKDEATAERTLEEIRGEIDAKTFKLKHYVSKRRLFDHWIRAFLQTKEFKYEGGKLSNKTIREYRRYTEKLIKYWGTTLVASIDTDSIDEYEAVLSKEAPVESRRVFEFLRSAFKWGRGRGHVQDEVQFPTFEDIQHEPQSVPYELRVKVCKAVESKHFPICWFLIHQGCRVSEARALRHSDLNRDEWKVSYLQTFSGTELRPCLKEGNQASQFLTDEVSQMIEDRIPSALGSELLFPSFKGSPYGERSLARIWKRACVKVGIRPFDLKSASRTSVATELADAGANRYQIMAFLHHKNSKTADRYVDRSRINMKTTIRVLKDYRKKDSTEVVRP